ncbi:uncharacterized protein [Malus domestica]|uniref:uncharacterized protein isoform X3 n=1 Tax=Malus domestica TaxID=3750 RepID=UPI00397561D4
MNRPKTVAFIWLLYALFFYSLFRVALRNSDSSRNYSSASDAVISNKDRRSALYDQMGRDLKDHGPVFLNRGGRTSQSLSLSDIFTIRDGSVAPVLKAANPPVRANVLYLSTQYSLPISKALKPILDPYFDKAIWFQNSSLYHFSMFHASHHISPVPATQDEIETEVAAVRTIAQGLCPLKIVLDRVVLTSTGNLWIRSYNHSSKIEDRTSTCTRKATSVVSCSMMLRFFILHLQGFLVTQKHHPRCYLILQIKSTSSKSLFIV